MKEKEWNCDIMSDGQVEVKKYYHSVVIYAKEVVKKLMTGMTMITVMKYKKKTRQ